MVQNYRQLQAHAGPWFDHWRRQTARGVGAMLVEDVMRAEFAGGAELEPGAATESGDET